MKKSKRVMVRFSPEVYEALVKTAKLQGVTMSELIRGIVHQKMTVYEWPEMGPPAGMVNASS